MASLLFFFLTASICSLTADARINVPSTNLKFDLTHLGSELGLPILDRLHRMAEHSKVRYFTFCSKIFDNYDSKSAAPQVQLGFLGGGFSMEISLGTPPQTYTALMDTGSDLVWTQCAPCNSCNTNDQPVFQPSKSSTYSRIGCDNPVCKSITSRCWDQNGCQYYYAYGGGSSSTGFLGTETLTLGGDKSRYSFKGMQFGCGNSNPGTDDDIAGIVGLGRGGLSLISQLGPTIGYRFGYCLSIINEAPFGKLILGSSAQIGNANNALVTPMIQNPAHPEFYYLKLNGISLGSKLLNIPSSVFEFTANGSGGIIIDSGTSFTQLHETAYSIVRQELLAAVRLPLVESPLPGFDLCFPANSSEVLPNLTFHFEGADLELPKTNVFMELPDALCFGISPSTQELSIFGVLQQCDHNIIYDLQRGSITFQSADCRQF